MIKPAREAMFTRRDLKASKMAPLFFDMIFNLNKFALYERRDPYLLVNCFSVLLTVLFFLGGNEE